MARLPRVGSRLRPRGSPREGYLYEAQRPPSKPIPLRCSQPKKGWGPDGDGLAGPPAGGPEVEPRTGWRPLMVSGETTLLDRRWRRPQGLAPAPLREFQTASRDGRRLGVRRGRGRRQESRRSEGTCSGRRESQRGAGQSRRAGTASREAGHPPWRRRLSASEFFWKKIRPLTPVSSGTDRLRGGNSLWYLGQ